MAKSTTNNETLASNPKPKPSTPIRVVDTTTRSTVFKGHDHQTLIVKGKKK
jgi:hypothetical protein